MLEAGVGEPEVVEPMVEAQPSDGDAEVGHVGEVRQSHLPQFVLLTDDDVLIDALHGAPSLYSPVQVPPDPFAQIGMTAQDLLEDDHRTQAGCGFEERHDLGLEHSGEGIRPPPTARGFFGRGPGADRR